MVLPITVCPSIRHDAIRTRMPARFLPGLLADQSEVSNETRQTPRKTQILQFYPIRQYPIGTGETMIDIRADLDTLISVGLIVQELVPNPFSHAFPERRKGTVSIECTLYAEGKIRIVCHDSRTGMPSGIDAKNPYFPGPLPHEQPCRSAGRDNGEQRGQGATFIIPLHNKEDPVLP